jgi:hypothetical protein
MPENAERIKYADVFVVRLQTPEQMEMLLMFFGTQWQAPPCWDRAKVEEAAQ